jgi:hypothetical protein
MTAFTPGPAVSFRDADLPRALAARMIAVAHRHPRGWTVATADGSRIEALTFEAVTDAVSATTGVRHLLIIWTDRDAV